jgi:hypothetical protein
MPVEYMEVVSALGSIAAKHPQTMGLLMSSYNSYKDVADALEKARNEYQQASKTATGALDKAGILMQIAALHPDIIKFLAQVLTTWQTRIPDLVQILNEFQAASATAYKS